MGRDGGFTLIELLIVVVIIGILAAIAIPQFSTTKEKAFDASARSDLRNLISAQETYFAGEGEYAEDLTTLEAETRFNPTTGVGMSMDRPDAVTYRADASHEQSTACYRVEMGSGADQEIARVDGADSGGGECSG
jgi:prepilin-type N-terminal cleavage/methylation domain-containing protein